MIEIDIEERELFDDSRNLFINIKGGHYRLEHSLLAVSKWEAKYKKPFCSPEEKTPEEIIDYMSMMNIDDTFMDVRGLKNEQIIKIHDYIEDKRTAQKFKSDSNGKSNTGYSKEIITSELIYYWMSALQIPFEAERWNFNRLIALIRLASIKNAPEQKETKAEALKRTRETNLAMRAKYEKKK